MAENKNPFPTCHDCGVEEGELHEMGCDMERCPFCGRQLISCDCCYEKLGYTIDFSHPTMGLPAEIYHNGLSEDQWQKWLAILNEKGRIPYIVYPNVCAKCGTVNPAMFMVDNEEWKHYIQPDQRRSILCRHCYDYIINITDGGKFAEAVREKSRKRR